MTTSRWPEKVMEALRRYPAGAVLTTTDIARLAGVARCGLVPRLQELEPFGLVVCHSRTAKPWQWTRGPAEDVSDALQRFRAARAKPRRVDTGRSAMRRAEGYVASYPAAGLKLRDLMADGCSVSCDPLAELADCMAVARAVLAAKGRPGARFAGAEVDMMVGRELRAVAMAAQQAASNLRTALEAMLG